MNEANAYNNATRAARRAHIAATEAARPRTPITEAVPTGRTLTEAQVDAAADALLTAITTAPPVSPAPPDLTPAEVARLEPFEFQAYAAAHWNHRIGPPPSDTAPFWDGFAG